MKEAILRHLIAEMENIKEDLASGSVCSDYAAYRGMVGGYGALEDVKRFIEEYDAKSDDDTI